ncbi:hypothetical protein T484DRAFT_1962883 [Baffinella frigidus]|nr:hypothetical protein T484DRAFT_1962883 [Cryptophyta sp. CCMP2293]
MSSPPAPVLARTDSALDTAAPKVGAGGIASLLSAVERVACPKNAPEGGDGGDASLRKGPVPRTEEVHFAPSGPGGSASDDDVDCDDATKLNASGFVDTVIPRRRGNEKKVVLTRALLESYHHESLDTVTERLGLSKTTVKAACRKLGLPKWPYQHTGPRKRRMGVPQEEQPGESAHEPARKDTSHELMGKRQRFGEVQTAPNVPMGLPLSSLPGSLPAPAMVDFQAMHMQSLSALSAMAATLNASGQNLRFTGTLQGSESVPGFSGQAPVHAPLMFGGNLGGNYGGNYMPDVVGGFQQWGGFTQH